jgi:exodeoxyribonuclease-3
MKILSWNVNGIRAALKKGFLSFLRKEKPDILLLQEVKISKVARAKEKFDFVNYQEYWHSAFRPGYSGTAILIKRDLTSKMGVKPLKVKKGLGENKFDREGRVQTLEFKEFYLINIYFPHITHQFTRFDFKLKFNQTFYDYAKKLGRKKPLIVGGDFNVALQEIDLARPKDNFGNPGFTNEERQWMDKFIRAGLVDTFRYLNKNKVQYTWWAYRFNARPRNIGWRIDYFLVSQKLIKSVKSALILDKVLGSDHCPIGIEIF